MFFHVSVILFKGVHAWSRVPFGGGYDWSHVPPGGELGYTRGGYTKGVGMSRGWVYQWRADIPEGVYAGISEGPVVGGYVYPHPPPDMVPRITTPPPVQATTTHGILW